MSVDSCLAVEQPPQTPSFRLKGGLFPLTLLELSDTDLDRLRDELSTKVEQAPAFFQQAPTVLSLENLDDTHADLDLEAIKQLCQEFGLLVVALRGVSEAQQSQAEQLNLALLSNSRTKASPEENQAIDNPPQEQVSSSDDADDAPAADEPDNETHLTESREAECKIITTPVRSGQQIYSAGDLVVLAPVSAGAELLADGNIHVYGPLRGRALAGVKGNTQARVFCQSLEAELISIAGYFRVNEDLRESHWKKSVQAFLTDETLNVEPL